MGLLGSQEKKAGLRAQFDLPDDGCLKLVCLVNIGSLLDTL